MLSVKSATFLICELKLLDITFTKKNKQKKKKKKDTYLMIETRKKKRKSYT